VTDVANLACTFSGNKMKAQLTNTASRYESYRFECVFLDETGTEHRLSGAAGLEPGESKLVAEDSVPNEIAEVKGKSLVEV